MKLKKLTATMALALGCVTLASCSSTTKASFSPNWCYDTTQENIISSETLKYEVSFQKGVDLDSYTVEYAKDQKGVYTTSLTPTHGETETVFVYTTSLSLPVAYTFGQQTATFTDTVTSEVRFLSTSKGLKPLYSKKTVKSHTPNASAISLENCYTTFDYDVEITYNENKGTSKLTDRAGTALSGDKTERITTFEASEKDDSLYVDNEQLYFALRCLSDDNTSLLCYSDAHRAVKSVGISFGASASEKFTFVKNGTSYSETLDYFPVSISYEGKNPGATQNFYIAKKTSTTKNENRNVLLKFSTPIAYGVGHIVYTLTEANFA